MANKTFKQRKIQDQLEILENQFSELYSLKNEMLTHEEGIFTALYLNSIGYKHYQKYRLNIDISIIKYRINLIKSFLDRKEKPDLELIEKKIIERFAEYQKKIEEERQRIDKANRYLKSGTINHENVQKIKSVYKKLIKRLHPDLHPYQTKYEQELFYMTQRAYHESDLNSLNTVLCNYNRYNSSHNNVVHLNSKSFIIKLENTVMLLRNQIEKLETQFPFSYRKKLANDDWVEMEQQILESEISALNDEKIKMSKYLLLLHVWKPESMN